MKTNIKATKITLTPAIEAYIKEKMDMLDKYLGSVAVTNCDVEVARDLNGQHKGEVFRVGLNLSVPGELLRVEKSEEDLYKAIDKVKDHMLRSIKRYKEKKMDKKHAGVEIELEETLDV